MLLLKVLAAVVTVFAIVALVRGPREAWRLWKRFGHAVGDLVGRVAMTVFYFTILVPFALYSRATKDPLTLRRRTAAWIDADQQADGLDAARRQF